MSVTLSEVKRAARAHRAPLAGESAGYLVLALADQVLNAPRLIEAKDVVLTEDGALRLLRGQASSDVDAELSLRRALDELLSVASSGSAALMRAGRRAAPIGLPALVKELEAALIPVNRAAARRALARVQRETARAVAAGALPEWVEVPAAEPALALPKPPEAEPAAPEETPTPCEPDDAETRAIRLPALESNELGAEAPIAASSLDGVGSAFGDEPAVLDESPSDALTVALDVSQTIAVPEARCDVLLEEDIEFIDEEPSDALTLVRELEVSPVVAESAAPQLDADLPQEVCTKPEPVILRRSQRPAAAPEIAAFLLEPPRTPTLGSLAAELPVLAPEQIAELSRSHEEYGDSAEVEPSLPVAADDALPELVACTLSIDECTEPVPEVEPLTHGVAIVASRKSDVSELLQSFQIAGDDGHRGLCRAIKEMAELDLTPAPFTALIR